jgi:hypothetical protein
LTLAGTGQTDATNAYNTLSVLPVGAVNDVGSARSGNVLFYFVG